MRVHHSQDCHLQPARLFDMPLFPSGNAHRPDRWILTLPHSIRTAMSGLVVGLQSRSIFVRHAIFATGRGRRTGETAVAFEADQRADEWQGAALALQLNRVIYPIQHNNHLFGQGRTELQLRESQLRSGRLSGDLLLIQDKGPTADRIRRGDHGRELPSPGNGLLAFRQIMRCRRAVISGGRRAWTGNARGINPDPQPTPNVRRRQILDENCSQHLLIDTTIFNGFINQRSLPFKPQRLHHFREKFGLLMRILPNPIHNYFTLFHNFIGKLHEYFYHTYFTLPTT